jgi:hypothetical protein
VGQMKLARSLVIAEKNPLVIWFTRVRKRLVEKGVLKEKEVEVLVYEDIDYWLSKPASVLRVPFKGLERILQDLKKIMEELKATVILPSEYQDELLGFLVLGEKTPDPFSQSD